MTTAVASGARSVLVVTGVVELMVCWDWADPSLVRPAVSGHAATAVPKRRVPSLDDVAGPQPAPVGRVLNKREEPLLGLHAVSLRQ